MSTLRNALTRDTLRARVTRELLWGFYATFIRARCAARIFCIVMGTIKPWVSVSMIKRRTCRPKFIKTLLLVPFFSDGWMYASIFSEGDASFPELWTTLRQKHNCGDYAPLEISAVDAVVDQSQDQMNVLNKRNNM